jgi:hypothetical protein
MQYLYQEFEGKRYNVQSMVYRRESSPTPKLLLRDQVGASSRSARSGSPRVDHWGRMTAGSDLWTLQTRFVESVAFGRCVLHSSFALAA